MQEHELGKRLDGWHEQREKLAQSLLEKDVDDLNRNMVDGASPQLLIMAGCIKSHLRCSHNCTSKQMCLAELDPGLLAMFMQDGTGSSHGFCCCAGLQFRKLISEINDTVQEYPEPLIDRCAGVIKTVTPTAHQYASIAFMLAVRPLGPSTGSATFPVDSACALQ